jgi:hypothetical protein
MQHKSAVPSLFPARRSLSATGRRIALWILAAPALFSQLMGCSVIGGVIGHGQDVAENRTRMVPVAEAASLRKGATVYLTIPNRETLKGRFAEIVEKDGRKSIRLKTPDGEMKVGLADVAEIAEDYRDHDKLIRGALIGGLLDIVLIGGPIWLYYEVNGRNGL